MESVRKILRVTIEVCASIALGAAPVVLVACANPPDPGAILRENPRMLIPKITVLFVDSDLNGETDKAVIRIYSGENQDANGSAEIRDADGEVIGEGEQGVGDDVIHIVVDVEEGEELAGTLCYTTDQGHRSLFTGGRGSVLRGGGLDRSTGM